MLRNRENEPQAEELTDLVFSPVPGTVKTYGGRTAGGSIQRAAIPGGWLVAWSQVAGAQPVCVFHVPDPDHVWQGGSLSL